MRVLIIVKRSPTHRYLIHLFTKALVEEIKDLIDRRQHSKAVATALTKGIMEREVFDEDIHGVDADLILSESNARWDLVK